jgi:predicted phosphodiesterase
MKLRSRLLKLLIVLASLLLLAAAGWYGTVYVQSQVTGDRSVYLQVAAPDAMTLRWGTQQAAADTVVYGLTVDKLDMQRAETDATVNHRVRLTGLQADTRYYYRIQHQGKWLQSQAEWFVTSPAADKPRAARVWLWGDPGKDREKITVRDSGLAWLQAHAKQRNTYADLVITTGDNAYPSATNAQYQKEFFTPFQSILKNIPLWTVLGNHDARRWTFYNLFDRPANGEAGGFSSGSEQYFSFDYGYAHFILLDNHHYDLSPQSPMLTWLKEDIRQTKGKWVIVFFHHPPYTGGTYDSDNEHHSRGRMKHTRENLVPVFEQLGVDMVISGHSHVYERSPLIHCHYALSNTFANWMVMNAGEQQDGLLQYTKAPQFAAGMTGTMYMVLGSSGEGNKRNINHPALPFTSAKAGTIVLDIDEQSLTSRYITADGMEEDPFRIIKQPSDVKPATECRAN